VIEDGKVKEAHVEPDNTGVNGLSSHPLHDRNKLTDLTVSVAEKVLA
jgi:hypothetical protein